VSVLFYFPFRVTVGTPGRGQNLRIGGKNMQRSQKVQKIDRSKKTAILFLNAMAIAIIILGSIFSIYSGFSGVSYTVMNNQVPGLVFGLLVIFLGCRYFLSVRKLKAEVYKPTSSFSLNNFKK
jgi:fatty acid desaturase